MKVGFISLLLIFICSSVSCAQKPTAKEQAVQEKAPPEAKARTARFKRAPDFTLQDLNQNTFTLSSYKDKQPVLLFFWTTWCPYCRAELKTLSDLYPQLTKEGWEVFAIDVAEPAYRVENFVKSRGALSFKVLLVEDGAVMNAYGLLGVPTYVLVDKEGYIVFKDNSFPREKYKELISE